MHIMGTRYYKGICMCRPSRAPPVGRLSACPLLWEVEVVTASRWYKVVYAFAMCALGFCSPFTLEVRQQILPDRLPPNWFIADTPVLEL